VYWLQRAVRIEMEISERKKKENKDSLKVIGEIKEAQKKKKD